MFSVVAIAPEDKIYLEFCNHVSGNNNQMVPCKKHDLMILINLDRKHLKWRSLPLAKAQKNI